WTLGARRADSRSTASTSTPRTGSAPTSAPTRSVGSASSSSVRRARETSSCARGRTTSASCSPARRRSTSTSGARAAWCAASAAWGRAAEPTDRSDRVGYELFFRRAVVALVDLTVRPPAVPVVKLLAGRILALVYLVRVHGDLFPRLF